MFSPDRHKTTSFIQNILNTKVRVKLDSAPSISFCVTAFGSELQLPRYHWDAKIHSVARLSHISLGMIAAFTLNVWVNLRKGETTRIENNWVQDSWERPATPLILESWRLCGRCKLWAKRCNTYEIEDSQSNSARASTEEPSGPCANTQHVMRVESEAVPELALDVSSMLAVRKLVHSWFRSTYMRVCWFFWHRRQWLVDQHCFTKCPGSRLLIKTLLDCTADILASFERVLNWRHANMGCFSVSHRAQFASEVPAVNKLICLFINVFFGLLSIGCLLSVVEVSEACAHRSRNSNSFP